MHTKWQKQLITGHKPVHIFSFRMMEINVCLTRVPFNRWKSFQELSTNGMLNGSHECSHYYKLPPAVLRRRSAFTNCSQLHLKWHLGLGGIVFLEESSTKNTNLLKCFKMYTIERAIHGSAAAYATNPHVPNTSTIHWHRWWGLLQYGPGRWAGSIHEGVAGGLVCWVSPVKMDPTQITQD